MNHRFVTYSLKLNVSLIFYKVNNYCKYCTRMSLSTVFIFIIVVRVVLDIYTSRDCEIIHSAVKSTNLYHLDYNGI